MTRRQAAGRFCGPNGSTTWRCSRTISGSGCSASINASTVPGKGLSDRSQTEIGHQADGGNGDGEEGLGIVEYGGQQKTEHQNDRYCQKLLLGDDECHRCKEDCR